MALSTWKLLTYVTYHYTRTVVCTALVWMSILFIISSIKKNITLVDIGWGLGFILISAHTWVHFPFFHVRKLITMMVIGIWGIRLSIHLALRIFKKGEDLRYEELKQKWQHYTYIKSFIYIFLLQGILMSIISCSLFVIMSTPQPTFNMLDFLGLSLWIFGFFYEAISDWQLSQFLENPRNKGKIFNSGLWYYSRHPNYFGEITQWWGIWIIACAASSWGIITIISPLLLTYIICNISGIPLVEKQLANNATYKAYMQRTNTLIPWFPRSNGDDK